MCFCCIKNSRDVGSYIEELQCKEYKSSDEREKMDCFEEGDYVERMRLNRPFVNEEEEDEKGMVKMKGTLVIQWFKN